MDSTRSDLHLVRRDGDLCWDGNSLSEVAREFGTPLYVVNRHILESSYERITGSFIRNEVDAQVFFSMKTNPIPEVVHILAEVGCGAEVISADELKIALDAGIPGDRIIVNGMVKTDVLLEEAVHNKVALINIGDNDELHRLDAIAQRINTVVNVGLRVRPRIRSSRFNMTLATSRPGSPAGFTKGGHEWAAALRLLEDSKHLTLRGLHFHLGSGITSVKPYKQALRSIAPLWRSLCDAGFPMERLDIGGGFNVPSLKTYSPWETIRMIGWGKASTHQPAALSMELLDDVGSACRAFIDAQPKACRPRIFVEPGRALVATSQLLLLSIQAIKTNERGERFAFCDAGAMSLSPMLWSEWHQVLAVQQSSTALRKTYTLLGNMPAPFDIVGFQRELPELHPGSLIAVLDTGAYFTTFGNTFSGSIPAIALIESGSAKLIRPRLTSSELFAY